MCSNFRLGITTVNRLLLLLSPFSLSFTQDISQLDCFRLPMLVLEDDYKTATVLQSAEAPFHVRHQRSHSFECCMVISFALALALLAVSLIILSLG